MNATVKATATVSGPVTGGKHGWPFAASMLDTSALGYEEHEYFLTGTASRYVDVDDSTSRRDGHWQAAVAGTDEFSTRFIVYRPADPARFNGTVILTWNNVTAGHDLFSADSLQLFESGTALVCLTTQKVGIEGLPPLHQGLAQWDAERYGSLTIPSDDYSYDIFTQAALAVGPQRSGVTDPMGGLQVERVVALGASQSAGRLATYINAIQPLTHAMDGFILAIYFGRGTPLEVGDTVVNINAPQAQSPQQRLTGQNLVRDDTGVPVFVVNSELEAIACYNVRQDDTETFRYWESAGTCHVSQQVGAARQRMHARDEIKSRPQAEGINAIPMALLYDAVFHHMQHWLADGVQPPVQPKIEFDQDGQVIRDELGIAKGGIRLPQVEVPIATNSAIPRGEDIFAMLGGSSEPFGAETLATMYDNKASFLKNFEAAAMKAVEAQVLMPRDVDVLVKEADERWP